MTKISVHGRSVDVAPVFPKTDEIRHILKKKCCADMNLPQRVTDRSFKIKQGDGIQG